jgi:hypothetical protein
MPNDPGKDARHADCSICSQLADYEWARQKYGREEEDTFLPDAANSFKLVKDLKPNRSRRLELHQCPQCQTYYLYKTDYEFLATGSEDDQTLTRLTDEQAATYLGTEA